MKERISGVLKKALKDGKDEFDRNFGIDPRDYKTRDVTETSRSIKHIRDSILREIESGITEVNWEDHDSVDTFCGKIDQFVAQKGPRFAGAMSKIGGRTSPSEVWQNFVKWQRDLRNKTKEEILKEIQEFKAEQKRQKAAAEGPAVVSAWTPAEEEKPRPPRKVQPDKMPSDEVEVPREKQKRTEVVPLPPVDEEVVFGNMEKTAREVGVPANIAEAIHIYTEALRSGDTQGAAHYLPELLSLVAKIEKDRQDAEDLWAEEESARLKMEGIEELLISQGEEIERLKKEREEIAKTLAERASIEQILRDQVKDLEALVQDRPKVAEVKTVDFDLSPIKHMLAGRETALNNAISDLEDKSLELVRWLQEANNYITTELSRRRATAKGEDELAMIARLEKRLNESLEARTEEQNKIDELLGKLVREHNEVKSQIMALLVFQKVKEAASVTPESETMSILVPEARDLPDIGDWLIETERLVASEPIPVVERKNDAKIITVEGLPFRIEYSEDDERKVHEFEKFLESFKGKSRVDIEIALPIETEDEFKKSYVDELFEALSEGTFLPDLKIALVTSGAMRAEDNQFFDWMAKTIGLTLYRKEVGIIKSLKESSTITRSFLQSAMISELRPDYKLVDRSKILKWGPANKLTPLGQIASQVWTKELLDSGKITRKQLEAMFEVAKFESGKITREELIAIFEAKKRKK